MHKFHVNIDPPKAGWLPVRISGPDGRISIVASYTPHDGFYDLVSGLRALYELGGTKIVRLHEEPDWIEITFSKVNDKLVIQSTSANDGPIRLEANFDTGCREFARKFKLLLDGVGYDGFAREWRHRPHGTRFESSGVTSKGSRRTSASTPETATVEERDRHRATETDSPTAA